MNAIKTLDDAVCVVTQRNAAYGDPATSLAAIAARCMKAATPEDEYWTRFSTVSAIQTGHSSQPIRQPVMQKYFENELMTTAFSDSRAAVSTGTA